MKSELLFVDHLLIEPSACWPPQSSTKYYQYYLYFFLRPNSNRWPTYPFSIAPFHCSTHTNRRLIFGRFCAGLYLTFRLLFCARNTKIRRTLFTRLGANDRKSLENCEAHSFSLLFLSVLHPPRRPVALLTREPAFSFGNWLFFFASLAVLVRTPCSPRFVIAVFRVCVISRSHAWAFSLAAASSSVSQNANGLATERLRNAQSEW